MISMSRLEIGIYIKSNLKISLDKVFQNIPYGGLGMIDIKNYIGLTAAPLFLLLTIATSLWVITHYVSFGRS